MTEKQFRRYHLSRLGRQILVKSRVETLFYHSWTNFPPFLHEIFFHSLVSALLYTLLQVDRNHPPSPLSALSVDLMLPDLLFGSSGELARIEDMSHLGDIREEE